VSYFDCNSHFLLNSTSSTYVSGELPAPTASPFQTSFRTAAEFALMEALEEAEGLHEHDPNAQEMPSADARREAYGLLDLLPPGIIAPHPLIEPAGDIAWTWDEADAFLVLAVSGVGALEWSAAIDGVESHGVLPLLDTLQPELRDKLVGHFLSAHA
jgi:hypothetical protein